MTVKERIRTIRLMQKIGNTPEYAKAIGLSLTEGKVEHTLTWKEESKENESQN